jgi:hypothetical protein
MFIQDFFFEISMVKKKANNIIQKIFREII